MGETEESALSEILNLPAVKDSGAKVEVYDYARASYTGLVYPTKAYFPTWVIPEDHIITGVLQDSYKDLFDAKPLTDKWTFSTNGVSIMGKYGIPCIGFGPGHEDEAHAPNEKTWKEELVKATAMYSVIPKKYVQKFKDGEDK